jgi:hypothetical protein
MRSDAGTVRSRDAVARELDGECRGFWEASARRLTREINAGWLLSGWLPWATGIVAVGTFGMLYARWRSAAAGPWMLAAIGAGLGAAALAAWWRVRDRFETPASARVRLEDAMGLDARLTAAAAGVGSWPAAPAAGEIRWPVTWRWQRPAAILAFLGCLLALATWMPIEGLEQVRSHAIEKPADARTVEGWLDALAREAAVDERDVEETKARIAELLQRPAENWYEHASLEAAGALKERTEAALRELAENLAAAERTADQLAAMEAALPADLRDDLLAELRAAAEGLAQGDFTPAADLAEMLRELGPMGPNGACPCDRATMQRLARALAANRQSLERALSSAPGLDRDAIERALALGAGSMRDGLGVPGDRRDGDGAPGRGGLNRGRGDAELSLGAERDLGTTRKEKVDLTIDPDRAAPGEVLAVVDGKHDVDETAYTGPQRGGAVAHEGAGGMAAQVDVLLPAERDAVRRFFE